MILSVQGLPAQDRYCESYDDYKHEAWQENAVESGGRFGVRFLNSQIMKGLLAGHPDLLQEFNSVKKTYAREHAKNVLDILSRMGWIEL